jgi:hypothetical protein
MAYKTEPLRSKLDPSLMNIANTVAFFQKLRRSGDGRFEAVKRLYRLWGLRPEAIPYASGANLERRSEGSDPGP